MVRWSRFLLVLALVLAACGGGGTGEADTSTTAGGGDVTTTAAVETTTTQAEADDDGGSIGLGDIPQECIDLFVEFLQAIEPIIEDLDFVNLSLDDLEALGEDVDLAMSGYDEELEAAGCDEDLDVDASDEESFQFLIDLAEDEAPGTVGYLEWIRDFTADAGQEASGDCDTDIAAVETIIAEGGTMQSLSLAEVTYVGSLITSIQVNCSAETSAEFFGRSDVQAFLGSG